MQNNDLSSNLSIVLSSHVINTIKGLPQPDRNIIVQALVSELILGEQDAVELTSFQSLLYFMIKYYIDKDSLKAAKCV